MVTSRFVKVLENDHALINISKYVEHKRYKIFYVSRMVFWYALGISQSDLPFPERMQRKVSLLDCCIPKRSINKRQIQFKSFFRNEPFTLDVCNEPDSVGEEVITIWLSDEREIFIDSVIADDFKNKRVYFREFLPERNIQLINSIS